MAGHELGALGLLGSVGKGPRGLVAPSQHDPGLAGVLGVLGVVVGGGWVRMEVRGRCQASASLSLSGAAIGSVG